MSFKIENDVLTFSAENLDNACDDDVVAEYHQAILMEKHMKAYKRAASKVLEARALRRQGLVELAKSSERVAQKYYDMLPEWMRW